MKIIEKIAGADPMEKKASTGFQELLNYVDESNAYWRSPEGRSEAKRRLSEKLAGMSFTKQDRPEKVKEIYRALKRDHPEMSAEMKARIASKFGKPGVQEKGGPYKTPLSGK